MLYILENFKEQPSRSFLFFFFKYQWEFSVEFEIFTEVDVNELIKDCLQPAGSHHISVGGASRSLPPAWTPSELGHTACRQLWAGVREEQVFHFSQRTCLGSQSKAACQQTALQQGLGEFLGGYAICPPA